MFSTPIKGAEEGSWGEKPSQCMVTIITVIITLKKLKKKDNVVDSNADVQESPYQNSPARTAVPQQRQSI